MTPEMRAKKSAECMWAEDQCSQSMGMKLIEVTPGCATLSMQVQEQHTNGHKICHGGIIYTLADSAFAFACNSYNQRVVAAHTHVSYLRPAKLDDTLTASAREVEKAGRTGIYDVTIKNQEQETISEFRGISRSIKGTIFDE